MSGRKFGFAMILAAATLSACVGDQTATNPRSAESQNTAGITQDISATFSTRDSTMNPQAPASFRE